MKTSIKRLAILFFFTCSPVFCQSNTGELHLKVTDLAGLGDKTTVLIVSRNAC